MSDFPSLFGREYGPEHGTFPRLSLGERISQADVDIPDTQPSDGSSGQVDPPT